MNLPAGQDDVLVVGGGIIGIACAHYLSSAGLKVTVIDQGAMAGACSHANCGYICPSHVLPLTEPGAIGVALKSLLNRNAPFRVKPQLSPALWNWMWQFARRCRLRQMLGAGKHLQAMLDSSMKEYRRLIAEERLECEWQEKGLLYVLHTSRGFRQFTHTDQLLTEHFGVAARRIEGRDLPSFDGALKPGLAGGFHYPGDASVRPDLLNAAWIQRLRNRGVRFIAGCRLQQLTIQQDRVIGLETSLGSMNANHYVMATGAWTGKWSRQLRLPIPVEPGKGYSVTMTRPARCPSYPMLFPEHKVGVSPFEQGYRLGSIMEFAGFDSSIPPRRIQQLRKSAEVYLVEPHTPGKEESWYGWRPMTWDSLPIIGRVPGLENALLATGHNMLGLSLATATGRLVAELIRGVSTHLDCRPFAPDRFQRRPSRSAGPAND